MNNFEPRWLLVLPANALLAVLLSWVTQSLHPLSLNLFLPAAFILLSGFYCDLRTAFPLALISGLCLDAMQPLPFGTNAVLLMLGTAILRVMREQLRRESNLQVTLAGFILNGLLFLVFMLLMLGLRPTSLDGTLIVRLLVDLSLSQLVLILIIRWYLDFQKSLLRLTGMEPDSEEKVDP